MLRAIVGGFARRRAREVRGRRTRDLIRDLADLRVDALFAVVDVDALDLQQLVARRRGDRLGVLVGGGEPGFDALRRRSARLRRPAPSTISASGTTRTTLPRTNRWPLPRPAAMPRSASRASPGPLTTQPITATCSGMLRASSASCASRATRITSTSARPHDGHAMRSRPLRSRRPIASSSWRPAFASSTGSAVSEKRIVSPMPSASSVAMPAVDFTSPPGSGPASVTPRCSGMVDRLREQAVGVDHHRHVRRLHRDLHVVEVDLGEVGELALGRRDQRLGRGAAVAARRCRDRGCPRSRRCGSAARGPSPRARRS